MFLWQTYITKLWYYGVSKRCPTSTLFQIDYYPNIYVWTLLTIVFVVVICAMTQRTWMYGYYHCFFFVVIFKRKHRNIRNMMKSTKNIHQYNRYAILKRLVFNSNYIWRFTIIETLSLKFFYLWNRDKRDNTCMRQRCKNMKKRL